MRYHNPIVAPNRSRQHLKTVLETITQQMGRVRADGKWFI
jgi:hypothetical protein